MGYVCNTGSKTKKRFYAIDKPTIQSLKSFIVGLKGFLQIFLKDLIQYLSTSILFTYPRNLIHSHHPVTSKQEKNW